VSSGQRRYSDATPAPTLPSSNAQVVRFMPNTANVELLRETTFFHGIDDRYLLELAPLCRQEEFANKTTIFEGSDRAKEVHFIVDGQISLAICDAAGCRQVAVIGRGDVMGWAPLIGRSRLFDAARTISPVRTIVIDADGLLKLCTAHPEFGFEFMRRAARVLGERLSSTRLQLLEIGGVRLPAFQLESD
jgi:CRP/FNR family transcriptional regulator, cyclic AMP receptor protein